MPGELYKHTDEYVLITATDTTQKRLDDAIQVTYPITKTVQNGGANENLLLAVATPPRCRAYLSGNQINLVDGTWTKIALNAETYDTGIFDSTTNYRCLPTVAGYYLVTGQVLFFNLVANKRYSAAFYKNGATMVQAHGQTGDGTDYLTVAPSSKIVYMNGSTDYIELYARSGSGGNTVDVEGATHSTFLCVHKLS